MVAEAGALATDTGSEAHTAPRSGRREIGAVATSRAKAWLLPRSSREDWI